METCGTFPKPHGCIRDMAADPTQVSGTTIPLATCWSASPKAGARSLTKQEQRSWWASGGWGARVCTLARRQSARWQERGHEGPRERGQVAGASFVPVAPLTPQASKRTSFSNPGGRFRLFISLSPRLTMIPVPGLTLASSRHAWPGQRPTALVRLVFQGLL